MIKVHHAGKMGDIVYALPAMRALHRTTGHKIHLITSGHCWQLAPLLWEQPYMGEIDLDDSRPYEIKNLVTNHWHYFDEGQGYNFSLQPRMYEPTAPMSWTRCYAAIAGVELTPADMVALPSLINHRRWYTDIQVEVNGVTQSRRPTIVIAPEVESLDPAHPSIWSTVIDSLLDDYTVILVGRYRETLFHPDVIDMRGLTTVASLGRIIAEATGFLGAHSFPWHLARHATVPAVCLQTWQEGLARCVPVDTACTWMDPEDWRNAVQHVKQSALTPVR